MCFPLNFMRKILAVRHQILMELRLCSMFAPLKVAFSRAVSFASFVLQHHVPEAPEGQASLEDRVQKCCPKKNLQLLCWLQGGKRPFHREPKNSNCRNCCWIWNKSTSFLGTNTLAHKTDGHVHNQKNVQLSSNTWLPQHTSWGSNKSASTWMLMCRQWQKW